ncbi:DUF4282 domain-containing protein [Henriciella marina]|uniref:DUF4282 domain-containing protein n=1 Tax=Henriciella marina TaxID=453851 RepID=A0ABT4LRD0_9PROT|nr:DUF4282 domain-containing protein [Henriciella marina]MCZ4296917.1 DUF4282 domain-containing protein [Henriciella marina]
MNWFSNFLSFEKPLGELLTRLLFYLFIIFIIWRGVETLVFYLTYFGENFGMALWGILKTPVVVIVQLLMLRVFTEAVLAVLRLDKSHEE